MPRFDFSGGISVHADNVEDAKREAREIVNEIDGCGEWSLWLDSDKEPEVDDDD